MSCYMAHSDIPRPAVYKYLESRQAELADTLQQFLDRYAAHSSKLTIDDDNVGRGLVCAFLNNSAKIEGVMVYGKKQEIQRYLEKHGYQCTHFSGSDLIQCVKNRPVARL